jgi:hypothetical protein
MGSTTYVLFTTLLQLVTNCQKVVGKAVNGTGCCAGNVFNCDWCITVTTPRWLHVVRKGLKSAPKFALHKLTQP